MSLKVYQGDEASRDYEYDFFRELSSNLVKMFEEENIDGILIGHPSVPANQNLKPDCVLITPNRLVIIDFKNHSGKIWLPSEGSFEDQPWRHDGIIIEGGRSINPFAQLKKQRNWIEDLIGDTYGKFGIACVVCFQGDMNIMNKVPGKYQAWFSVTNAYQCLNRIKDIIGIKNENKVDIEKIRSYFEAKPYHDYYPVKLEEIEALGIANARSEEAEKRELEAEEKVKELEEKIKKAESETKAADELKEQLKKAKESAEKAKKEANAAKKEFDDKKHALDLATQNAIKAKAEAEKAKAEEKKAEIKANVDLQKNKTKRISIILFTAVILIGIIASIAIVIDKNNRDLQRKEEEKAQLEENYKNGRTCIPVERVEDFVNSKGVCIDFYANYINDSPKYVFIDNAKNGKFSLMIPKTLITEEESRSKYLNKHLQARGTITKYEDTYEIFISNLSQIEIK